MKRDITFISDTHSRHNELTNDLKGGWMIIHAGDVSNRGETTDINEFTEWFGNLPYKHKIFIAGNHDFGFEVDYIEKITGIDFFPELDNATENELEAQQDYKKWSF